MDWGVSRYGNDLFIVGPGVLTITLRNFNPGRVKVTHYTAEELGGENGLFEDLRYRFWEYEVSPGILLILYSSWDVKAPGSDRHYLEIDHGAWNSLWEHVPREFAEDIVKGTFESPEELC